MDRITTYNWTLAKIIVAVVLTGVLLLGVGAVGLVGYMIWYDYGGQSDRDREKVMKKYNVTSGNQPSSSSRGR